MAKKRIAASEGQLYLESLPNSQAMAVRYLLQVLEDRAPGGAIELRVPPFGAAQLIGGLSHRRGTPPNVVELSPEDFLNLALGESSWDALVASGRLLASGSRATELRNLFPIDGVR